jgi:hypothetical protein
MKDKIDYISLASKIINSKYDQYKRVELIRALSKKKKDDRIDTTYVLNKFKSIYKTASEEEKPIIADYIVYVEYVSGIAADRILNNEKDNKTFWQKLWNKN